MVLQGILYLIIFIITMLIGLAVGALVGILIFSFLFQLYEWKYGRRRIPSALVRASAALGAIIGVILMRTPMSWLFNWLGLTLPSP